METLPQFHPNYFPPRKIWILGAGHFGRLACKRLQKRYTAASFRVIDSRQENLDAIEKDFKLSVYLQEAISYLNEAQLDESAWIIPAIPIHVAFHWVLSQLSRAKNISELDVPKMADQQVPNPFRMNSKTLYASFATFICPDGCNEPDEICTYTGEKRQGNLFEHLKQIHIPGFQVVIVRSWQLAPGVGGYPMISLKSSLDEINRAPGKYLIATSCRCHGVVDALEWQLKF